MACGSRSLGGRFDHLREARELHQQRLRMVVRERVEMAQAVGEVET